MAVNTVGNQKTIQEIIDASSAKTSTRNTSALGKDDFLNLLVTQLRYQDPLKPVDDKEFIGQMAQFSALEQMQNMNSTLSQSQGFSLIGKHIVANVKDTKTGDINVVEGDVSNVKVANGKITVIADGQEIPLDTITNVTDSSRTTSASEISKYTDLIGYSVDGLVYDPKTYNIVSVNGNVKAIQKGQYEDNAVMDGAKINVSAVLTDKPSKDPGDIENYLSSNKGKTVSVEAIDTKTGQTVPVTGTLKDYSVGQDGIITAVLDDLNIPVESIETITKA